MKILIPDVTGVTHINNTKYTIDYGLVEYASILKQIESIYDKYKLTLLSKKYKYDSIHIGVDDKEFVDDINFDLSVRDKIKMSDEDYSALIMALTKANLYVDFIEDKITKNEYYCEYASFITIDEYKTYFDNALFQTIKHVDVNMKEPNTVKAKHYAAQNLIRESTNVFRIVEYNHIVVKPSNILIGPNSFILISNLKLPKDFMFNNYSEEYEGFCAEYKTTSGKHIKDKNGNDHFYKAIPYNMLINIKVVNASILTRKVID